MKPKIKFIVDKNKDFLTFKTFIKESKYGNSSLIECAFFFFFPELKKYIKKEEKNGYFCVTDIKAIKEFIDQKYEKNAQLIKKNIKVRKFAWEKKENIYYELVKELFDEKYWPKGKYIAYSTIWGVYPKFLKEKTFQIPVIKMNKEFAVSVIAHEMLHFVFYNYFLKNYPKYNIKNNSFFIWNVSEAFNEIVQNQPKWLKKFRLGCDIYGGRKLIVKKLQKKHYKLNKIDTKNLIDDIIKEIKNSKEIILKD